MIGQIRLKPVDLVSSAPWARVAFTTYALSLSFFEAVVLEALLRARARGALILSDPEGVRAALSEEGARRVGRDYEVVPVSCNLPGVFHPKIGILSTGDDTHLIVGSGNLTFSGWGVNLEVIEHLHPSFAADAFDDAAVFFDALSNSDAVTTTAGGPCQELAADLRKAANRGNRDGRFRLLHSLDAPIAEQIALYADELGGATRIVVASPYFDIDGNAISRLAAETGCENILLHAHSTGSVSGGVAPAWPFDATKAWEPVVVQHLGSDDRRLHAKTMEVLCRRGRLLLAGSANATEAGLFGRNIEASVLRVQRDTKSFWLTSRGLSPTRPLADEEKKDDDAPHEIGILSAKLDGDTIAGLLLTAFRAGAMNASLRSPQGTEILGEIQVEASGQFSIRAEGVEFEALQTGRLILRLEQHHQAWEGFLSIAVTLELIRRTGTIASRLIAMLGGTDTPADVAAILAWFKDDPTRLSGLSEMGSTRTLAETVARGATFVSLGDLASAHLDNKSAARSDSGSEVAWERAMSMIRATFRQARGPWLTGDLSDDDEQEEDAAAQRERTKSNQEHRDRAQKAFTDLLDVMLDPASAGKNAPLALSLAHFLTDRMRPERSEVQHWLHRILNQVAKISGPETDVIVAGALLYHSLPQRGSGPIRARRFFVKRGLDPRTATVDPSCISAFIDVLHPSVDLSSELTQAQDAVTMGEQIQSYVAAANGSGPCAGFDELKKSPHWPRLLRALGDKNEFAKFSVVDAAIDLCPRKHIRLPTASRSSLALDGIAKCDCCGRIILNTDC